MFAKARPPGIYKQHYIDDLFTFYHEPRPAAIVYPSTPEWKRPETPDLNGIATTDQDEDDEDDFMAALQVRGFLLFVVCMADAVYMHNEGEGAILVHVTGYILWLCPILESARIFLYLPYTAAFTHIPSLLRGSFHSAPDFVMYFALHCKAVYNCKCTHAIAV